MHLQPGTLLQDGKYRIENVIGQGGFGITYRCIQVYLAREVVIKEFFIGDYCVRDKDTGEVSVPSVAPREMVTRYRKKFIKEAQIISSLSHRAIVKIHDIFEEKGTAYYVMEYLKGKSLAQVSGEMGKLPEKDVIHFVAEVGSALKYVHGKHINHLDVKPGNIILCDDGRVVLIDFGVSKHYSFVTNKGTTTTPAGISPGYSPIEQYLQDGVSTFTPQSDVYALAATAFKLLTGARPLEAMAIKESHLRSELAHCQVSEPVVNAIVAAMKRERNQRTQSIAEFLKQLTAVGTKKALPTKIEQLHEMAERGDAEAQFYMARCYKSGNGVMKDLTKAVHWLKEAAKQGHVKAQNNLGLCYANGDAVPKDYKEAASWFKKAADQGIAEAQYNLGLCYCKGKGLSCDLPMAAHWFKKAAVQGYDKAQYRLGVCLFNGEGVSKDESQAVNWWRKAAEQGHTEAKKVLKHMREKKTKKFNAFQQEPKEPQKDSNNNGEGNNRPKTATSYLGWIFALIVLGAILYFVINGGKTEQLAPKVETQYVEQENEPIDIPQETDEKPSALHEESFSEKWEHTTWKRIDNYYPFIYPSFMEKIESDCARDIYTIEQYIYKDVTLCYVPMFGAADDLYPNEGDKLSSTDYVKEVIMHFKNNTITSGYTSRGYVFYSKEKFIPGNEVSHGTSLTLIYPKEMQKEIEPFIEKIKDW